MNNGFDADGLAKLLSWPNPLLPEVRPVEDYIDAEVVEDRWDRVIDPIFGRPMHFDRQGNPISMRRWGELRETGLDGDGRFGDGAYVRIGYDEFDDDVHVSTVWLGMDHGFPYGEVGEDYQPIIFETMIFGGEHDQFTLRYATEEEADAGHRAVVWALRNGRFDQLEESDD